MCMPVHMHRLLGALRRQRSPQPRFMPGVDQNDAPFMADRPLPPPAACEPPNGCSKRFDTVQRLHQVLGESGCGHPEGGPARMQAKCSRAERRPTVDRRTEGGRMTESYGREEGQRCEQQYPLRGRTSSRASLPGGQRDVRPDASLSTPVRKYGDVSRARMRPAGHPLAGQARERGDIAENIVERAQRSGRGGTGRTPARRGRRVRRARMPL